MTMQRDTLDQDHRMWLCKIIAIKFQEPQHHVMFDLQPHPKCTTKLIFSERPLIVWDLKPNVVYHRLIGLDDPLNDMKVVLLTGRVSNLGTSDQ